MSLHLQLPNELLFKVLAHVLAYSVHMVVVSPGDIEWHLRVHHTLSARQLQYLRSLGVAIRDPSALGNFSIGSLDSTAPQLVQGYSLYIAIVYLRTQASRSTAEIYHSTSATIFGAVVTLSKVLYSRIVPREVSVMLKFATEDEAELSHVGILVVRQCAMLSGCVDALTDELDPADEAAGLRRDLNRLKAEQMIGNIDAADVTFLALFRRSVPLPCCTAIWLSQLPDVYATLQRVYDVVSQRSLISEDAVTQLRSLVERWAPPPPPALPSATETSTGETGAAAG
ncbi:hypothetical protein GGX14DRAFT_677771 [Mycena pura]|uniref:Uncharacterized protein n=1 Tax=Mycena pura TaxID=153505 RepID=A0AAD6UY54_9AGAR|nr:hypothetical protein GGX14DRAFT_677771 [Mycena pura]